MSTRVLKKNNKYIFIVITVLVVLAGLVLFVFKGVFSALSTAYEVETKLPDSELRINKDRLFEAEKAVFEKEVLPLTVGGEESVTEVVESE